MKVKLEQLATQLQRTKSALPIYMVTGDEALLHGEAADLIRRNLREHDFSERELMHVDAQFNWEQVFESANSLSLFAERKIVELRLGAQKINKASSDLLQRYLSNPAPDTALVILADKQDGSAKKSAWFKAIETHGLVVEIWPVEVENLTHWLSQRAAKLGLSFEQEALQTLADRVEGNLLAAQQELEKLTLVYPNQCLNTEQVEAAVSDSSRFDIFALTDAALQSQAARCQHIVHALKQEGLETTVVLWALTRELRSIYRVIEGIAEGKNYDQLAQRERLWGKRKQLVRNASRRISLNELQAMLGMAAEADAAIKGQRIADPWLIIGQISLRLAGIRLLQFEQNV